MHIYVCCFGCEACGTLKLWLVLDQFNPKVDACMFISGAAELFFMHVDHMEFVLLRCKFCSYAFLLFKSDLLGLSVCLTVVC